LIDLINKAIKNKILYAKIEKLKKKDEGYGYILNFYNKLTLPENRKEFIKMIIALIGFFAFILLYIFFNSIILV